MFLHDCFPQIVSFENCFFPLMLVLELWSTCHWRETSFWWALDQTLYKQNFAFLLFMVHTVGTALMLYKDRVGDRTWRSETYCLKVKIEQGEERRVGKLGKEYKFLVSQTSVSPGQATNALAGFDFLKNTAAVRGSKMQMLKVTGFKGCMAQNTMWHGAGGTRLRNMHLKKRSTIYSKLLPLLISPLLECTQWLLCMYECL